MEATTIAGVVTASIGVASFSCIVGGMVLRDSFKTKKSCEKEQVECRTRVCIKIDDLKTDIQKQIAKIDQKREDARKENLEFQRALFRHMGKVEQFMEDQKK